MDDQIRNELKGFLKEQMVGQGAFILAYGALLRNLAAHINKRDPNFAPHARALFDISLGMMLAESMDVSPHREQLRRQAREQFMSILDELKGPSAKPSLRRRFLNWLERG